MNRFRSQLLTFAATCVCGMLLGGASALADQADQGDQADPPGRVARVNLLEGRGALQLAGTDAWVEDVLNRPLTGGDRIWIESGSRAELHVGSTALRLGATTALQIVSIDDQSVRLRLTAGAMSVRLRRLDDDERFDVETPAGDVEITAAGGYRFDVDDREDHARFAVWSGRAVTHGPGGDHELHGGDTADMVGGDDPATDLVDAGATDSLDLWAEDRDRREDRSPSAQYVSRDVVGYEELDGYGDWVVDPVYGSVWVPQTVAIDWAPYRFGYWSWIGPWGWTWIDDAPWGFAPCHYGRWVRVRHGWGWAPGPSHERRPVFAPALVAWVGAPPGRLTDPRYTRRVGWVPLGYNEVYRPPFHASHDYVRDVNLSNTHLGRGELDRGLDDDSRRGDGRPGHRYAHEAVAGAYTSVSRDTFVQARPVGRNRLDVSAEELRRAPLSTGRIDIAPGERSRGRTLPTDRPGMRPDSAVFERPVVSTAEPALRPRTSLPPRAVDAPPRAIDVPPRAIDAPPRSGRDPAWTSPRELPRASFGGRPFERPAERVGVAPATPPAPASIARPTPEPAASSIAPPAPPLPPAAPPVYRRLEQPIERPVMREPMPPVRESRPVFTPAPAPAAAPRPAPVAPAARDSHPAAAPAASQNNPRYERHPERDAH